jgi:hypothetical protein
MGEGFIVRRGGGGQQTVKPIYNSLTEADTNSLTLSVTNDSNSIATLYYSVVNTEPAPAQAGTFDTEFQDKETKDITITGLTQGTTYTVYLRAIAIGEFPSETVIVSNLATQAIIYTAATGGTTTEYDDGGTRYKSHTFTSNGTFTVTTVGNQDRNQVDYLIIAGGAGGGYNRGGGGGAGGYRTTNGTSGGNSSAESKVVVTAQSYTITIGAGGNGRTSSGGTGNNGVNTTALGITSTGGGGGGTSGVFNGVNGGSGGGAAREIPHLGGDGIAGQGSDGGDGVTSPRVGGGGGGAFEAGNTDGAGAGGDGLANLLRTGSNETRGGGGGGGGNISTTGGTGGGGNGSTGNGSAGTANTGGGGGGGGSDKNGGNGGSGIVVIRYEIAPSV